MVGETLTQLGVLMFKIGDYAATNACFREALQIGYEISSNPIMLDVLIEMASLFTDQQHYELALELLAMLRAQYGDHKARVEATERHMADLSPYFSPENYNAIVERGTTLDLKTRVKLLLEESP